MKYNFIILFSLLIIFSGCKNELPEGTDENLIDEPAIENPKFDERNVLIDFSETTFNSDKEIELLKEMNICDIQQKDLTNASRPACDPKFFKVMSYTGDQPLENAFMVISRAGVHDWPLRRVMILQREGKSLVNVNTFIGNLVGNKPSKSNYDDLFIQFLDEYENRLECEFVWNNGRYKYNSVRRINGSNVKADLIDSMTVEIGKELNRLKVLK